LGKNTTHNNTVSLSEHWLIPAGGETPGGTTQGEVFPVGEKAENHLAMMKVIPPLKLNIDTQNSRVLKGDTFSKPSFFGRYLC